MISSVISSIIAPLLSVCIFAGIRLHSVRRHISAARHSAWRRLRSRISSFQRRALRTRPAAGVAAAWRVILEMASFTGQLKQR